MTGVRRCTVSLTAMVVAFAATAALAQASGMTVQAAVRSQDRAIAATPAIKKILKGNTPPSVSKAITKLTATADSDLGLAAGS